jgi:leucine-rich repeat protein SHOC2
MEQAELEQIIEKARLDRVSEFSLDSKKIGVLPESIGNLSDLKSLCLSGNQLTSLPDSIFNLHNLTSLDLHLNWLTNLSPNIDKLLNLTHLNLHSNCINILPNELGTLIHLIDLNLWGNELVDIPASLRNLLKLEDLDLGENKLDALPGIISHFSELTWIDLDGNQLTDLSILQNLPKLETVEFLVLDLPRRYWTKFTEWKSEWLLDENNTEIKRLLVKQLGYEKICQDVGAFPLDTWRGYTLLKIDGVETIYDNGGWEPIDREPMLLLKMTCPSTNHIHILRVPPEMVSAEAAITWINQGIHPDEFAVQT